MASGVTCRAAVLRGVGGEWEIEDITLDPPRAGEVLVKMSVAGVCHSDDHYATGDGVFSPELTAMVEATGGSAPEYFPMVGGHEGAGVVEEVGPGVRSVAPGDRVATSFIPACGKCRWCVSGMTYLCDAGAMLFAKGMTTDGTSRRHLGAEDLTAMTQLGTFSEYMVVAEESVIKIDDSIPSEAASLVSCGVTTGWGSATVGVGTEVGDTVVIVGTGGVGINAVQGARAAGANSVVAVDPVDFKRDTAKFFGATDTSPSMEEAFPLVKEITNGVMADRVVLTPSVLHAELLAPALSLTRKGGTCLMTAVPKLDLNTVPLLLIDMLQGCKTLKGLLYGGMNPRASMPKLLSMYRSGNLKLDELVTKRYRLDQINDAITDMREGRNIRGMIEFG
jgi:S-(hydroxymethyl)glutathione dehydrogenase/alcohol dehydrogenase